MVSQFLKSLVSGSTEPAAEEKRAEGTRKRVLSQAAPAYHLRKRKRVDGEASGSQGESSTSQAHRLDASSDDEENPFLEPAPPHPPRIPSTSVGSLSRQSSLPSISVGSLSRRASLPSISVGSLSRRSSLSSLTTTVCNEGVGLMRSYSASSLAASQPASPTYPESSAKHYLRPQRMTLDFSVSEEDAQAGVYPLSWSVENMVVFGRGNRVHYKNVVANDEVGQLCKLRENHGNLRLIQCAGLDRPHTVAICNSKGTIQLWDLSTKKMTSSWTTKEVSAMKWKGAILTVGYLRGTIRHFDTRIKESPKLKQQAKRVTRHETKISSLAWNVTGEYLASGDADGLVHVWDSRKQDTSLDVGDLVQRRHKMKHEGPVQALAWSPWNHKLLASGDGMPKDDDQKSTIRVWDLNFSTASHTERYPNKIVLDTPITSLHFAGDCKELVSTHGLGSVIPSTRAATPIDLNDPYLGATEPRRPRFANSVVVWSYPNLREVTAVPAGSKNIAGSVLSPNGQRIMLAVPEDHKLQLWDIWGKRKELKRASSFMDSHSTKIR